MRLDKFLWFTRFTKTRPLAQQLIAAGHLRIDGQRCDKPHAEVRAGQVLSFPLGSRVRIVRVQRLPSRRGPAPEAQACYADLTTQDRGTRSADAVGHADQDGGRTGALRPVHNAQQD